MSTAVHNDVFAIRILLVEYDSLVGKSCLIRDDHSEIGKHLLTLPDRQTSIFRPPVYVDYPFFRFLFPVQTGVVVDLPSLCPFLR